MLCAEPGAAGVTFVLNCIEEPEPGGCELDDSEAVIELEVGVEPPTHPLVELLGTIDVRNWDNDYLQLHVEAHEARAADHVFFHLSHSGFLSQPSGCCKLSQLIMCAIAKSTASRDVVFSL